MGASTGRRALAQNLRCLPECLHAGKGISRKVVRADEERIVVQRLRPWWFVVRIVQTNQGISEESCKQAPGLINLFLRCLPRLENFWQVRSHLCIGVMIVIDACRPFGSLSIGENWPRHLKFPRLGSQKDHVFWWLFPACLLG